MPCAEKLNDEKFFNPRRWSRRWRITRTATLSLFMYLRRMRRKDDCPGRAPLMRIAWSGLGAFLGILAIRLLAGFLNHVDVLFLIGSFGASAVLVYGAPLAHFSQPRNILGGHIFSAISGVAIAKLSMVLGIDAITFLAPAFAVSLAVIVMHLTRTIHPPGGATALIAVIGGKAVQDLGWFFVVCPVAIGAWVMVLVALGINNLSTSSHQHYPTYWL